MAKKEAQAPQAGAVQEEVKTAEELNTSEETQTEEGTVETQATEETVLEDEAQAPQAGAASIGVQYIKTIPNKFDVRGVEIPDEEFGLADIDDLDEEQEVAFKHAVKCGIIKEVE